MLQEGTKETSRVELWANSWLGKFDTRNEYNRIWLNITGQVTGKQLLEDEIYEPFVTLTLLQFATQNKLTQQTIVFQKRILSINL